MDKKVEQFIKSDFSNNFLINFIPGLVLILPLLRFLNIGDGLISFTILLVSSWLLGILIEKLFFKKVYKSRENPDNITLLNFYELLFGKVGVALILGAIIRIIGLINEIYNSHAFVLIIPPFLMIIIGLLLINSYKRNISNSLHDQGHAGEK